ncbi:phage tail protein [Bradyrhizobium liaoningense]|uniref:phage tail protein n=1 Tax=Bradyrhizobium liaoningense TaxID=43992 RepID=UPI001BAC06FA|nr:phage tail protein [Bradyrhizobium liaoningense]MBR0820216.1 phage tail protein [Bradyrhizobium liaoningense]
MAAINELRSDPMLNHNFVVSLLDTSSVLATVGSALVSGLLDVAVGGFSECQGLEASMKVEEFNEGGNNGAVLKFPGRVSWTNITLKRGVAGNSSLWDWFYGFVEGRGKRRDGVIVLLNEMMVPNNIWYFRRGLPLKYSGPQMNATQNNVAIESMEISHEGIYQLPFVGLASSLSSALTGGGAGGLVTAGVSGTAGLVG